MARDRWLEIEVRHLAALHAVSDEGSFSGAAERLGYVQSAISQQIAFLEAVAGARLVERSRGPGPVRLTAAGRLMLHRVGEIFGQLDAAQVDLSDLTRRELHTVRLGTGPGLLSGVLAKVVGRLAKQRPDILLDLHDVDDEEELLELLATGRLDLGLTELPPPSDTFGGMPLLSEPYVVLAAKDSPFNRPAARWSLVALAQQRIVAPPATRSFGRVQECFDAHGARLRIAHRSGDAATIAAWANAGIALAIVPSREAPAEWPSLAAVVTEEALPTRTVGLVWTSERPLSAAAAATRDMALHVYEAARCAPPL